MQMRGASAGSGTPQKPKALTPLLHKIPKVLREMPRFGCWRHNWDAKQQSYRKLPVSATTGYPLKTSDPSLWATFAVAREALARAKPGELDGLAFLLPGDWIGIDVDDCINPDAEEPLSELAQRVLAWAKGTPESGPRAYAEVSPSGRGIKLLCRADAATIARGAVKRAGLELYVNSARYFALTGHVLGPVPQVWEPQNLGWLQDEADAMSGGGTDSGAVVDGDAAERALALYRPPLEGYSDPDTVGELLEQLAPHRCDEYDSWLTVGMALHHQAGGDADLEAALLDVWDLWSESSNSYVPGVCQEKWAGFMQQRPSGRGPATMATIIKWVKEDAVTRSISTAALLVARIEACTSGALLRQKLAAEVRAADLDVVDFEKVAVAYKAALQRVENVGLSMSATRKLLAAPTTPTTPTSGGGGNGGGGGGSTMPDWAKDWVFLTSGDVFFNLTTKEEVTGRGFDTKFNRRLTGAQRQLSGSASWHMANAWSCPVAAHTAYVPWLDQHFVMDGKAVANLYRPGSVPVAIEPDADQELVLHELKKHVQEMFPKHWTDVMAWLSWQIQRTGQKIRWAPYIWSLIQGTGKTMLAQILRAALGPENVGDVSNEVLRSQFNGWAQGSAVLVIEETKATGHNRHDVANRLKPIITNDRIEIHRKGRDSYTTLNTANTLLLSNHQDGLPVDQHDRRYLWLRVELSAERVAELKASGFFQRVFDLIEQAPGVLRWWLEQWEIPADFNPHGDAPWSEEKSDAVSESASDLDDAVEELLLAGGHPDIGPDFIFLPALRTALKARDLDPSKRAMGAAVRRFGKGLERCRQTLYWNGVVGRAWVKASWAKLTGAEIVQRLKSRDFE